MRAMALPRGWRGCVLALVVLAGTGPLPGAQRGGVIVAFGDSITRGLHAGGGQGVGWPTVLAAQTGRTVTNAGIGGNALTRPSWGHPSALVRLEGDALRVPGASTVIVLLGINDLLSGVSAPRVEAALAVVVQRARARSLHVLVLTLTPAAGCAYCTPRAEAARRAVNRWLLAGHLSHAVAILDTAPVLGTPGDRTHLKPAFDSGDALHPNDAGYRALAGALGAALRRAEGVRRS